MAADTNRPGASFLDQFDDIGKALGVIDQRLPFVTDRNELGDAMCQAVELRERLSALTSQLAQTATNSLVAAEHGQRTIGQYVASRTNARALDVDRLARRAKWLRDFPIFEASHGHELTDAHIDYVRKNLDATYDTHRRLLEDQQFFVDTAASCSYTGFETACDYWLIHIDPDGKEPLDQIERTHLSFRAGRGGRGELAGSCDAMTAQAIRTALDYQANKLRVQDKDAGIERTPAQRNMAALAQLVAQGFARDDGSFPVPLGNIVMSLEVAEWAVSALADSSETHESVPVDHTNVDRRCELIDGTPIHPFLAVAALGLVNPGARVHPTNLRRYILDAKSRPLDVSVSARSFPEWIRTAALIESRGRCSTPGCDAPHSWLEIDHIQPVAHHGQTRLDNAQTQCRPDNQAKGATPGHTAWRNRPPPPQRSRRHRV